MTLKTVDIERSTPSKQYDQAVKTFDGTFFQDHFKEPLFLFPMDLLKESRSELQGRPIEWSALRLPFKALVTSTCHMCAAMSQDDEDHISCLYGSPDAKLVTTIHLYRHHDDSIRVRYWLTDLHGRERKVSQEDLPSDREIVNENARRLLFLVEILSQPSNMIVEEIPKEARKERKTKSRKLPRAHQRPRLFVVSMKEAARRVYKGTSHEGRETEVLPHLRRGHWAMLRHERYGDNRGKWIWRKPCWVGPEQSERGNTIYKVRLDL